jgi:hypothetical protein
MSLRSWTRSVILFLAVSLVISCKRSDSDLVPAFISVNSYSLQTDLETQGSNSSGITEFWCYTDGDILGVVDTPVSLPLLKEGRQTITVFAGIKNNGMGVSRIRYPFYTSFDTTLDVAPGQTYTLKPRFRYIENAVIDKSRDFNQPTNFQAESTKDGGTFERILRLDNQLKNDYYGLFTLPSNATLLGYRDLTSFSVISGSVAFMEMDYSCNNTFSVGVYVNQSGSLTKVPVLYLTPTQSGSEGLPNWNKIYMDLGMVAKQYPNATSYNLFIECSRNEAAVPVIYLDDIKIVK